MKHAPAVLLSVAIACAMVSAQGPARDHRPTLTAQHSGTANLLIAVSPVDADVVWASGINGTFTITTDGGRTWHAGVVPGAENLQFRDVQGVSAREAYLLSIGDNTTDFRIYKTTNGGATWTMQFQNQNPSAFYDCFAFWTPKRGIAHSDSANGVFPDLRTTDGMTWKDISGNMPPALLYESSFASSGTCVATQGDKNAWIATAISGVARILATRDGGHTWDAYDTPLMSSFTAGASTVAFRDPWHGMVGGGDLDPAYPDRAATATSRDGGRTWTFTNPPPVTGLIFGLSYTKNTTGVGGDCDDHKADGEGDDRKPGGEDGSHTVVVTADTGGAAWTRNEGRTWYVLPGVSGYWGVAFANAEAGWLVGRNGAILKISF